jgi:hypothetical protein
VKYDQVIDVGGAVMVLDDSENLVALLLKDPEKGLRRVDLDHVPERPLRSVGRFIKPMKVREIGRVLKYEPFVEAA